MFVVFVVAVDLFLLSDFCLRFVFFLLHVLFAFDFLGLLDWIRALNARS